MPGITAMENPCERSDIDEALQAVCLDDRYQRHDVLDENDAFITHTGYESYPVEVFEIDGYVVVLEGYLYGTDAVAEELSTVVTHLRDGNEQELRQWVADRDGDFLLFVAEQDEGKLWALNDAFGRLPTYRATIGDTTIVTRELKVIRDIARQRGEPLEPDRLALSQMLLFRYSLGTRTLFEDVEKLPPGSLVEVETGEVTSLYEHEFDEYENDNNSVSENARRLERLFLDACENRASVVDETVVSLSGGLDSRAVIAGYDTVTEQMSAATSASEEDKYSTEIVTAKQVAEALGTEWNFYTVSIEDRHSNNILDFTQGTNNVWMAKGLHFAEQVASDHADHTAMLVTGDGGDKAMPDLTPTQSADTLSELVDKIVDGQSYFPVESVTELTGVSRREIAASVRERVESYPESTLDAKHVHFLVRERGINWLNHGEDRTRYQLWSTTPFYSLPYFTEAMACSPKQKRGTRLYREFLQELSSAVVEIDYADFNAPITSLEYRAKRYAYDWLCDHPELKNRVLDLVRRDTGRSSTNRDLLRAINETNKHERAFPEEHLHRLLRDNDSYTDRQLHHLLTLQCAIANEDVEIRTNDGAMEVVREEHSTEVGTAVTND